MLPNGKRADFGLQTRPTQPVVPPLVLDFELHEGEIQIEEDKLVILGLCVSDRLRLRQIARELSSSANRFREPDV